MASQLQSHGGRLESRIARLSARLSGGLREVFATLPQPPRRARDIERLLGVKKDVASRIIRATNEIDALAAILLMPGPIPLREVLRAAKSLGADTNYVVKVSQALDEFECLILDELGDRVAFDGVVSSLLPAMREKQQVFAKQSVYRGMSQLKGARASVMLNTGILWPSRRAGRLDGVWLMGWYGLQRMIPGAAVHFATGIIGPGSEAAQPRTLAGNDSDSLSDMLLSPFSSIRQGELSEQRIGQSVHFVLAGDQVGRASAVDVTVANYTEGCLTTSTRRAEPRCNGPTMEISTPSKLAVLDVFVHRAAYPGIDPELRVFDTSVNGLADMNDAFRRIDRFDIVESVTPLGNGLRSARVPEIANYRDMLEHVFSARDLQPEDFRGYRCRSRYPIYGAQFAFAFSVPRQTD